MVGRGGGSGAAPSTVVWFLKAILKWNHTKGTSTARSTTSRPMAPTSSTVLRGPGSHLSEHSHSNHSWSHSKYRWRRVEDAG